jgi:putative transcriptional regulator
VITLLKYKQNILELLKNAGYNTSYIRKNNVFGESALQKMRNGKIVGIDVLGKICDLLHCQPGDLIEWIPDNLEPETKESAIPAPMPKEST